MSITITITIIIIIIIIITVTLRSRVTGMQLRSEDPASLKQIITITTTAAAAASGRATGATATARIDFLSDVRRVKALIPNFTKSFSLLIFARGNYRS